MSAREIAGISFGRLRNGLLVSLRVYLDGSGKEDDHPVITVGGFMAESAVCEDIEAEWEEATERREFHLRKFGTNRCKLGSRDWDEATRTSFLLRLAKIVNRKDCYIISASLEVAPFNETLAAANHPHEIGPAFSACAFSTICYAEDPLTREDRQMEAVRYVFEKGDREHEIAKVFRDWDKVSSQRCGRRGYGFEEKGLTLLQPSDLIAGIIQRCILRAHNAFPCLDNGNSRTSLNTFERHYSNDGVTLATVTGHDTNHCWVVNPKSLRTIDGISTRLFTEHPELLEERLKKSQFKPKVRRDEREIRVRNIQHSNGHDPQGETRDSEGGDGGGKARPGDEGETGGKARAGKAT